jgi:hypothetical protein
VDFTDNDDVELTSRDCDPTQQGFASHVSTYMNNIPIEFSVTFGEP